MNRFGRASNHPGTAGAVEEGRVRSRFAARAVPMLAVLAAVGTLYAAGPSPTPAHTSRKYWIGRNISEAEKEFGTPTFSEQLIETGGMLVIYASQRNPVHFVFETDAGGRIIKASKVE